MGHHGEPTFDSSVDRRLTATSDRLQKPILMVAAVCIGLAAACAFLFAETKGDKNFDPMHADVVLSTAVAELAEVEGKDITEYRNMPVPELVELIKTKLNNTKVPWDDYLGKSYGWQRLQASYLTAFVFVLSIMLGALFFVIIQHLTRAGWSVVVRRVAEVMAGTIKPLAILCLPLLLPLMFGDHSLYEWNDAEKLDTASASYDELLVHKRPVLNPTFFVLRAFIYLGVWILLGRFYLSKSIAQDSSGDSKLTMDQQFWAPVSMFLFAFSVNFFAFDFMMSLAPHWFSTIYGIYYFAGCVVSGIATMILVTSWLQKLGVIKEEVTVEHYHDLAKLLFGFTFFWGYIAFSQFILIWYANIPEETFWYLKRMENGWQWVSLVLLFGHLLIPFLGLMSRASRRTHKILKFWAVWMLTMHALDIYWNIVPHFVTRPGFNPTDVLMIVGVGAIGLSLFLKTATKLNVSMVPVRDPRMPESLAFHQI